MAQSVGGITVKLDMYGSTSSLGVDTNRRDRALRRCLVSGLTASVEDGSPSGSSHKLLQLAADAVFDAVGLFHHTTKGLRLQDIQARQWGQTKVWVDLIYFRGFENTGFLDTPAGNTFEFTRPVNATIPVYRHTTNLANGDPEFDSHNLPAGPMYGNAPLRLKNQFQFPWHYMFPREGTLITVPTLLTAHPYSAPGVADRISTVNSDFVKIGSINFAPFTLKFQTAHVTVKIGGFGSSANSIWYETLYEFVAIPGGHYIQQPVWIPAHEDPPGNPIPAEWGTSESVEWPAKTFVNAFPLRV